MLQLGDRGRRPFVAACLLSAWATFLGACGAAVSPAPAPVLLAQEPARAPAATDVPHSALSPVDAHVDPCVDFYDYACGPWRAAHPIPADRARWGIPDEVTRDNRERERAILEDALRAGDHGTPAEQRIAAFYTGCLDEPGIEARGLLPIAPLLTRIRGARTREALMGIITELAAHDVVALFDFGVAADLHEARRMMVSLGNGPVGMPSTADYASDDPRSVKLRASYREHLVRVFGLLGSTPAVASKEADAVVALETSLAGGALTPVERRNPDAHYKPMAPDELRKRFPALDIPALLRGVGAPPGPVNAPVEKWLDRANVAMGAKDLAPVRAYLQATIARRFAEVLPRAFREERFDFEQRISRGVAEMSPRAERCVGLLDANLGEDVGRTFVARHLDAASRARTSAMIEALRAALSRTLAKSDWLSPAAQTAAQKKLTSALIVLGASNRLRDLDGLTITQDDLFGDVWRAGEASVHYQVALLGRPTDREQFFDSLPQTYDGFGSKAMNATGFTAGFLQPPIYDPKLDDAVTFGGLGAIIGHELSHQLDDEGRKYDAEGNLRPWWSDADVSGFEARAQCFEDEYSHFHTEEGTALDGKLTLGENLADNNGLRLSYEALRPSEAGPKTDGFTPAQRFFLGWGQIRCENVTKETERRQAQSNPHAAGRWRVNGVVTNMPEFASAFSCQSGAPMAPVKRCRLW